MKSLKALISKNTIHRAHVKKSRVSNEYLVIPSSDFYTQYKKYKKPTYSFPEVDVWIMTYEEIDELFLVRVPKPSDIIRSEFLLYPMSDLPIDKEELYHFLKNYWGSDDSIGDVPPLTYDEIKELWGL